MDLSFIKTIHFVGIKGVAMTSLAIIAKEMGMRVTGSDTEEKFPTDETLSRFNISPLKGFASHQIRDDTDLVIYTGAHQGIHNIEVQIAISKKIPVLPHGKALGLFMRDKKGISVAGSHGKTTTSAMIAHVLMKSGLDPSFAIGCGNIISLNTPAHAGKGAYFAAEADEYVTDPTSDPTPRFMWQKPEAIVITNIDFDHPDVYSSLSDVEKAFAKFIFAMPKPGIVVGNADDAPARRVLKQAQNPTITYGTNPGVDYKLVNVVFGEGKTIFSIKHKAKNLGEFELSIPGTHNALNATSVVAVLNTLKLMPIDEIRRHLLTFTGTKRRFEKVAEKNGKLLFDDYAHHPVEIAATLAGVKAWFPKKRLVAIFQPHTYSRTKALLREFATCFYKADMVVLTEIYASAREKPIPGVSGALLEAEVCKQHPGVIFAATYADVLEYIRIQTRENDLILTMGAGDIYTWLPEIEAVL